MYVEIAEVVVDLMMVAMWAVRAGVMKVVEQHPLLTCPHVVIPVSEVGVELAMVCAPFQKTAVVADCVVPDHGLIWRGEVHCVDRDFAETVVSEHVDGLIRQHQVVIRHAVYAIVASAQEANVEDAYRRESLMKCYAGDLYWLPKTVVRKKEEDDSDDVDLGVHYRRLQT